MRSIAVLVVTVIQFRRHASEKFQGAISWSLNSGLRFSLYCLSIKHVISDHFRWSNVLVNQNKLKMCLHFDQIKFAHGTDIENFLSSPCTSMWSLFLRLVQLCEVFENCSIGLSHDWNHFYETTDHLQQFSADKFSTFFQERSFYVLLG